MQSFFNSVYGIITIVAGVVATFWGLFKAFGALKKWFIKKLKELKDKKQAPKKMMKKIEQIGEGIEQMKNQIDEINTQIVAIKEKLNDNDQATATVMLQKMMWAYHNYVLQQKPIPLDVQTALCVMYDQYVKSGAHNHIPSDFKKRIMACDIVGVSKGVIS